jgi:hypothetical protein
MPTVLSRRVEGGRFLLEVDDEKTIPEVVEAISAAGGRIYGVRAREHSLEDVYFEIQGGGGPTIGGSL